MEQNKMVKQIALVRNVSKSFDDHQVIKNLSLEMNEGEPFTILGPGSCGKSTLLKMLVGVVPPDSGSIHVLGQDIYAQNTTKTRETLKNIGVSFQQGGLFDFMTVRENILFALENMTNTEVSQREAHINSLLHQINLPNVLDKYPSELSGGMRRRVSIVRALSTSPKIAILDEPTSGLDPVTTTLVLDMIHRLSVQAKSTAICLTSSVEVAFRFAHRVALMRGGEVIAQGTFDELYALNDPWITNFLEVRALPFFKDKKQQSSQTNEVVEH